MLLDVETLDIATCRGTKFLDLAVGHHTGILDFAITRGFRHFDLMLAFDIAGTHFLFHAKTFGLDNQTTRDFRPFKFGTCLLCGDPDHPFTLDIRKLD